MSVRPNKIRIRKERPSEGRVQLVCTGGLHAETERHRQLVGASGPERGRRVESRMVRLVIAQAAESIAYDC